MARTAAILLARLIFAGVFAMAAAFKFVDMNATAGYIASIGFPAPLFFAWVAAFFEVGLALAFLSGAFFTEAALLAIAYVLFLSPSHSTAPTAGPAIRSSSASSSITSLSSLGCCWLRFTALATHWY